MGDPGDLDQIRNMLDRIPSLNPEITYEKYINKLDPIYDFVNINPDQNQQTFNITSTGGNFTDIKLPLQQVYNLSKSVIQWTHTFLASGAGTNNWAFIDTPAPIREIRAYLEDGQQIAYIQEVGALYKIISKALTKWTEALTNGDPETYCNYLHIPKKFDNINATPEANVNQGTSNDTAVTSNGLRGAITMNAIVVANTTHQFIVNNFYVRDDTMVRFRCNEKVSVTCGNVNANQFVITVNNGSAANTAVAPIIQYELDHINYKTLRENGLLPDSELVEPQYLLTRSHQTGYAGNTNTPSFPVRLHLGRLLRTFFSVNKDMFFGQNMYIRIIWEGTNKQGFSSTNAAAPSAGTADLVGQVAITNLQLKLAVQKNLVLRDSVRLKMLSQEGVLIVFPWVTLSRQTASTNNQNVDVRIQRSEGNILKEIWCGVFNATETGATSYDINNIGGSKITSYHTELDSQREQTEEVVIATGDDYRRIKHLLVNSCINNDNVFRRNWFHWAYYSKDDPSSTDQAHFLSGIPIQKEYVWSIHSLTAGNNLIYRIYYVTLRTIHISGGGVRVMYFVPDELLGL